MDIKRLTQNYRKRFEAHVGLVKKSNRSGSQKAPTVGASPNYVKEVIVPVIELLASEMPGHPIIVPDPETYALYGNFYRIKIGIKVVGGLSYPTYGDHNLYFTPLWHGQPCGERVRITTIGDLVNEINKQLK